MSVATVPDTPVSEAWAEQSHPNHPKTLPLWLSIQLGHC
jgi:hypothetical protein